MGQANGRTSTTSPSRAMSGTYVVDGGNFKVRDQNDINDFLDLEKGDTSSESQDDRGAAHLTLEMKSRTVRVDFFDNTTPTITCRIFSGCDLSENPTTWFIHLASILYNQERFAQRAQTANDQIKDHSLKLKETAEKMTDLVNASINFSQTDPLKFFTRQVLDSWKATQVTDEYPNYDGLPDSRHKENEFLRQWNVLLANYEIDQIGLTGAKQMQVLNNRNMAASGKNIAQVLETIETRFEHRISYSIV